MSTSIVFESGNIIDSVKKLAQIAPGKSGAAFDKAAGLLIQVTPDDEVKCLARATNLDIFYSEVVGCIEASGPDALWRLPSAQLAGVLSGLPIKSGNTVKFEQKDNKIHITSGRMRMVLNRMDETYYPSWDMFDPDSMSEVNGLGGKISMVEWAAAAGTGPPFGAIYLDGENIVATDRYKLVVAPLKVDLDAPVMVPQGLGVSLRQMGDIKMKVANGKLLIMPDDYTQIECILYDGDYAPWSMIARTDYETSVEVDKAMLMDIISRANQFAGSNRMPTVEMYFGKQEIAAMMTNDEIGLLGDVIAVPGQLDHPRVTFKFQPKYLTECLSKAPSSRVKLHYDQSNTRRPVYIDGGSGYQAWVIPLRNVSPGSA